MTFGDVYIEFYEFLDICVFTAQSSNRTLLPPHTKTSLKLPFIVKSSPTPSPRHPWSVLYHYHVIFGERHTNGTILSFSIMHLRSTHVTAYIDRLFFFFFYCWAVFLCVAVLENVYQFTYRKNSGYFQFRAIISKAAMNTHA